MSARADAPRYRAGEVIEADLTFDDRGFYLEARGIYDLWGRLIGVRIGGGLSGFSGLELTPGALREVLEMLGYTGGAWDSDLCGVRLRAELNAMSDHRLEREYTA